MVCEMVRVIILILLLIFAAFGGLDLYSRAKSCALAKQPIVSTPQAGLQANSLCAKDERIIFSCVTKRAAKIVSLCASKDLTNDRGYLQYRFGLPAKIELEFPKNRQGTQPQFHYSHYFRYQVDLTEINFTIDGYDYQIFDTYNGEEKPKISEQGVNVTVPG